MKRTVFTLMLLFGFLSAGAVDLAPVSTAFKAGNATALAPWMDKEVDMAVPGTSRICPATEALALLDAFFKANKPAAFVLLHNADKKDSGFLVGKLNAGNKSFRVNITYRTGENKLIIQSIRIE